MAGHKLEVQQWAPSKLKPSPRNARTHSAEQVAQIAASMKAFGFVNPILVDPEGEVIAGHGRLEAAKSLKFRTVPVIVLSDLTPVQIQALRLADNQIAANAGWDEKLLRIELGELRAVDFDIAKLGFSAEEVATLFGENNPGTQAGGVNYSRKIAAPIYEIRGEKPSADELVDNRKTVELVAEIEGADLPADVKAFLFQAATRHTVFNFAKIAEFYAHADAQTQRLMERSALVIIDFDKAIENGFVKLTEAMMDQAEQSKATNYA